MIRKWLQPLGHERKQEVLDELSRASSPGFDYFLLVTLSCSIATFGLMFGLLALWTRSLRPGILAHAGSDIVGGIFQL